MLNARMPSQVTNFHKNFGRTIFSMQFFQVPSTSQNLFKGAVKLVSPKPISQLKIFFVKIRHLKYYLLFWTFTLCFFLAFILHGVFPEFLIVMLMIFMIFLIITHTKEMIKKKQSYFKGTSIRFFFGYLK